MWKAVGIMAAGEPGRTSSHMMQGLKYNEFDYVKRIALENFNNPPVIKESRQRKKENHVPE